MRWEEIGVTIRDNIKADVCYDALALQTDPHYRDEMVNSTLVPKLLPRNVHCEMQIQVGEEVRGHKSPNCRPKSKFWMFISLLQSGTENVHNIAQSCVLESSWIHS